MAEPGPLLVGAGVALGVVAVGGAGPARIASSWRWSLGCVRGYYQRRALAADWTWLTPSRLALLDLGVATAGTALTLSLTGLMALALAAGGSALSLLNGLLLTRQGRLRSVREDAVLDSVRLLRQLLEAGGVSVGEAVSVLSERGPKPLRDEFALITEASVQGTSIRAWQAARARLEEPSFDLLAAAVTLQRPAGGELSPILHDLEAALSARLAVSREAQALQVQARGASAIILGLPYAFLFTLAALGSPYLAAYREIGGEMFLAAMLGVMAVSRRWISHLLALPLEPRLTIGRG